jgi:hypothetical protein
MITAHNLQLIFGSSSRNYFFPRQQFHADTTHYSCCQQKCSGKKYMRPRMCINKTSLLRELRPPGRQTQLPGIGACRLSCLTVSRGGRSPHRHPPTGMRSSHARPRPRAKISSGPHAGNDGLPAPVTSILNFNYKGSRIGGLGRLTFLCHSPSRLGEEGQPSSKAAGASPVLAAQLSVSEMERAAAARGVKAPRSCRLPSQRVVLAQVHDLPSKNKRTVPIPFRTTAVVVFVEKTSRSASQADLNSVITICGRRAKPIQYVRHQSYNKWKMEQPYNCMQM